MGHPKPDFGPHDGEIELEKFNGYLEVIKHFEAASTQVSKSGKDDIHPKSIMTTVVGKESAHWMRKKPAEETEETTVLQHDDNSGSQYSFIELPYMVMPPDTDDIALWRHEAKLEDGKK